MLHITKPIKKMEKPLVSFSDLSYIMTGLLYIYKEQATRCYGKFSSRHFTIFHKIIRKKTRVFSLYNENNFHSYAGRFESFGNNMWNRKHVALIAEKYFIHLEFKNYR